MKIYYRRHFLRYPGFISFPYIKKILNFNFQTSAVLVEPRCHFIQTLVLHSYCLALLHSTYFYSKDEAVTTKCNMIQQY